MLFTVLKCTECLLFSTEEIISATDEYLLKMLIAWESFISVFMITYTTSLLGAILSAHLFHIFQTYFILNSLFVVVLSHCYYNSDKDLAYTNLMPRWLAASNSI
jgi:hypothetical protein